MQFSKRNKNNDRVLAAPPGTNIRLRKFVEYTSCYVNSLLCGSLPYGLVIKRSILLLTHHPTLAISIISIAIRVRLSNDQHFSDYNQTAMLAVYGLTSHRTH